MVNMQSDPGFGRSAACQAPSIAFQYTKPHCSRYLPAPTFVFWQRHAASCSIFTQARQIVALVRHEVTFHNCKRHEFAHECHGGRIEEFGRLSIERTQIYSVPFADFVLHPIQASNQRIPSLVFSTK